jgi:hypothetical protein
MLFNSNTSEEWYYSLYFPGSDWSGAGYHVVISSCMVTGYSKHDTRDFIWTMHKAKEDWEASSK